MTNKLKLIAEPNFFHSEYRKGFFAFISFVASTIEQLKVEMEKNHHKGCALTFHFSVSSLVCSSEKNIQEMKREENPLSFEATPSPANTQWKF